jgi:hypothetical protein
MWGDITIVRTVLLDCEKLRIFGPVFDLRDKVCYMQLIMIVSFSDRFHKALM